MSLLPPTGPDLEWVMERLRDPEICRAFGFDVGDADSLPGWILDQEVFLGIAHIEDLAQARTRVGFALVFTPSAAQPFWEFAFAIPDPTHRRAGSAVPIADAMCFYLFEYIRIGGILFRVRSDNAACLGVVQRLGYPPWRTVRDADGGEIILHWLGKSRWADRRTELERASTPRPGFVATMPDGREPLRIPPPVERVTRS